MARVNFFQNVLGVLLIAAICSFSIPVLSQDFQSIRKQCIDYGFKEKSVDFETCINQLRKFSSSTTPIKSNLTNRQSLTAIFPILDSQKEEKFWDEAKQIGNKEAYQAYIEIYPTGRHVELAKANIERIRNEFNGKQQIKKENLVKLNDGDLLKRTENTNTVFKIFQDCPECPEMVAIPAGQFQMGAQPGEEERENVAQNLRNRSQPQHFVSVSSFSVARYEVTVAQYRAFVLASSWQIRDSCTVWSGSKYEADPAKDWRNAGFAQSDQHPVVCTNWDDAKAYAQWLKQKTGKEYRLLSESEWEYAARAGTKTARYWGDDPNLACNYANSADVRFKINVPGMSSWNAVECDDGYAYTAPVGSFKPNAFGLFDMLGNVLEWTQDCYSENYTSTPINGDAHYLGDCTRRVIRGGSWNTSSRNSRAADRTGILTSTSFAGLGFRVALSQ